MDKPHDQRHKALLGAVYEEWARVLLEHEVPSQRQAIDVVVEPRPGDVRENIEFPLLHRMSREGPCLFESYYNTPSVSEIDVCIRKQLVYYQHVLLRARRAGRQRPGKPRLWVLSSGRPKTVLRDFEARTMAGWPAGFWQTRRVDSVHVVVISELAATRETLILRLLGRGKTFHSALDELFALPPDSPERRLALPVLLAFPHHIPHHFFEEDSVNILQKIRAEHAEWEQRVRHEGRREGRQEGRQEGERTLLLRQLTSRFGPLPAGVVARIESASIAEIELWGDRILVAETLDDVLNGQSA